jgi:hypothetical protein
MFKISWPYLRQTFPPRLAGHCIFLCWNFFYFAGPLNTSLAFAAKAEPIPPAWRTSAASKKPGANDRDKGSDFDPSSGNESYNNKNAHSQDDFPKKVRPWYKPRVALGVGLNVPEVLPIESYLFFGRYVALHFFATPVLPLKIRIEMPSDVISTKKGVGVATPDFTIHMKARYGPHYGAEALVFPFGGSFFIGAGASYRKLRLTGSAKTPILICSLIEAAKEPPCGDPNASLRTETELELQADATTSAVLMRGSIGWFWHVGSSAYVMFNGGIVRPTHIRRGVSVTASVDSPGSDDDVNGALAQVKAEREADLESKALKEIHPFEEKPLPILGLSTGIRF